MITCSEIGKNGRFGNQMFQYAAAFAVAKKNQYILGMPYTNKSSDEYLNFCLQECFPFLSTVDSTGHKFYNSYREESFTFDPKLFDIKDNTDINGYFQSPKYFAEYKNFILAEFQFASKYYEEAKYLRNKFDKEVISLHIRLGDYTLNKNCHPICDLTYYKKSLECIPNVADKQIFLFSDDILLAKQILSNLNCNTITTTNKFVDMCLMTLCDYHIIANSTFSWWGAYLSNSKKVCAPEKWFGKSNTVPQNWKDIYCDEWCVL